MTADRGVCGKTQHHHFRCLCIHTPLEGLKACFAEKSALKFVPEDALSHRVLCIRHTSFLLFHPIYCLRLSFFLSPSHSSGRNSDQPLGHTAGFPFSPVSSTVRASPGSFFYREKTFNPFFPRRLASNWSAYAICVLEVTASFHRSVGSATLSSATLYTTAFLRML